MLNQIQLKLTKRQRAELVDRVPSVSRILLAKSKPSNFNGFRSGHPGGATK
jgi:hypothetical protein